MPATLASQNIQNLIKNGSIISGSKISDKQVQPASLDLTLSNEAYRVRGSFLPSRSEDVIDLINEFALYKIDLSQTVTLEKNGTYIVKLKERLKLPQNIYAYTNNKSSTGRVDLQTRILSNKNPRFDKIHTAYEGELYLEISPKSFLITIQAGLSLNQVRFFDTRAEGNGMNIDEIYDEYELLYDKSGRAIPKEQVLMDDGLLLTIDLDSEIIGYRSKNVNEIMDLTKIGKAERRNFFQPIYRPDNGHLFLEKGHFYILSSHEFVRVPPNFSVEMIPYDIASGEFRSHYAGFFDPGFGYGKEGEIKGTPGVLEVRVYEDDFILRPGQPVCKIVYDRLKNPSEIIYGTGELKSNYSEQRGPRLAKFFRQ